MNVPGVDISAMQGNVDFNSLYASGVRFVICRCGVGNDGKDSDYDKNVAAATAAGLKVAAYHFVYPLPSLAGDSTRDPAAQAQLHFGWASTSPVPVICCDFEWPLPQNWAQWGCTAAQINQWCLTYLQEYQRLSGQTMVIYTFPYFAQALNLPAAFAQYPLWIASYEPSPEIPAPWTNWVLWQNSDSGKLPTTGVAVDTDLAKDLSLWDTLTSSPPSVVIPQPPAVPVPISAPTPVPIPAPIIPATIPSISTLQSIFNAISSWFAKFLTWFKDDYKP